MAVLSGKVAIITGGGSGIGAAAAELFAKEGASLVLSDVNEENGSRVVSGIVENGGKAVFIKADTAVAADSGRTVQLAVDTYGRLDIAVNNAGIGGVQAKVADYPLDSWHQVIGINLSGVFFGMKYQLAEMEKAGSGSIINVASILGAVGAAGSAAYVAAKHGVVGLTKAAAIESASKGVRINAVGPGYIETPLLNMLPEEQLDKLVRLHPIGRLGKAGEVASLLLWLASDAASFATGAYYPVDGGYIAR